MADYSYPDLEEDFRAEIPEGPSLLWEGETHAHVTTGFILTGESDAVIADVIATAENEGWTFVGEPASSSDGYQGWYASKELSVGLAALSVNLGPPDATDDYDLALSLGFVEDPTPDP